MVCDCVFDSINVYLRCKMRLDIDSGYGSSAVPITYHIFQMYVYMYSIYIYVCACSVAEIYK
jgi:hypothetical protein